MAKTTFTCIHNLGAQGGGVQWDPETGKTLARFEADGLFTTEDDTTIEKLKALGYKVVSEEKPKKKKGGDEE